MIQFLDKYVKLKRKLTILNLIQYLLNGNLVIKDKAKNH